jgi:hypothetical protein
MRSLLVVGHHPPERTTKPCRSKPHTADRFCLFYGSIQGCKFTRDIPLLFTTAQAQCRLCYCRSSGRGVDPGIAPSEHRSRDWQHSDMTINRNSF